MDDKKIFEAAEACRKIFGQRAANLIRETCDFATIIPKLAKIISAR